MIRAGIEPVPRSSYKATALPSKRTRLAKAAWNRPPTLFFTRRVQFYTGQKKSLLLKFSVLLSSVKIEAFISTAENICFAFFFQFCYLEKYFQSSFFRWIKSCWWIFSTIFSTLVFFVFVTCGQYFVLVQILYVRF